MDSTMNFASKDRIQKPAVNIHQFNRMLSTPSKSAMDYPRVQLTLSDGGLAYEQGSVTSFDPSQSQVPYKSVGKSANITNNYLNISPALMQFKRQAHQCCHNIIGGLQNQPSHLCDLIRKLSEEYRGIVEGPKSTASFILPTVVKQAQVAENNCPKYSHCYSSLLDQLTPSLIPVSVGFTEPTVGFVVLGSEPTDSLQKLLEPFASVADIFKPSNSCSSCEESSKPTSEPAEPSHPQSFKVTEDQRTNLPESEVLQSTASINSCQEPMTNCEQPSGEEPVITKYTLSSEPIDSFNDTFSIAVEPKDTILENIESKENFQEPFHSFLEPNPFSGDKNNYLKTNHPQTEQICTEPTSSNDRLKGFPRLSELEITSSSLGETVQLSVKPVSNSIPHKEPFPTLLKPEARTSCKESVEPHKSYAEVARMVAKGTGVCGKAVANPGQTKGGMKLHTSSCGRSWQRDQSNFRRDEYLKDGRSNKGVKLKKPTAQQKLSLKKNNERHTKNNEKHPNYHKNSGKEYFSKKFMGLEKSDLNNGKNNQNYSALCQQQQQYFNHKSSNCNQNNNTSNISRKIIQDRPYSNEKHPNYHQGTGDKSFRETCQKYLRLDETKNYCDLNNSTCDSHQNVCKNWRCKQHPQEYKTFVKTAQPLKYCKTSAPTCDKRDAYYEKCPIYFQTSHNYDRNSKKYDANREIDNKTKKSDTSETKGNNVDECSKRGQDQIRQVAASVKPSYVRNTIQRMICLPSDTLKALNVCKTLKSGEECLKKLSNMTDASIEKARDYVVKAHALVANLNDSGARNRSFSECSEDSFVVFDSSDCGELDSEDSESEESEDEDEVRLRLVNERWDKQIEENVKRRADHDRDLSRTNERKAVNRNTSPYPMTCTSNSAIKYDGAPTKASANKKVRFLGEGLAEIHTMVTWSFAYQAARCGQWEEMARDRERFKLRIQRSERVLSAVLTPEHRDKVLAQRGDFT